MSQYVALLRGIAPMNPNMRNEKLRGLFEELGFTNVRTVISSGNVLFESPSSDCKKLEEHIEKALPERLNFTSTTIIRSKEQIEKLILDDPFKGFEHTKLTSLDVTFLKNKTTIDIQYPHKVANKSYTLHAGYDDTICSVINILEDKTPDYMVWMEKKFGKQITTRTWRTVERIYKAMDK
jgi:uncharacterized protein (DUF1697 family)